MGLEIKEMTGGYTRVPILKDLTFSVDSGEIVGLIGLNGAGKSTTIKHIMGFLKAQQGDIRVEGHTIEDDPTLYRRQIAYIPETPSLYPELTLEDHLKTSQLAYALDEDVFRRRVDYLLESYRLEDKMDVFPHHFSKGMQQKVMIIAALMIEAPLLVIDEPFLGLDPLAIRQLLKDVQRLKDQGSAILMSTHVLDTAERVCDRFVILHEGCVLSQGSLDELQTMHGMPGASLDDIYFSVTGYGDQA